MSQAVPFLSVCSPHVAVIHIENSPRYAPCVSELKRVFGDDIDVEKMLFRATNLKTEEAFVDACERDARVALFARHTDRFWSKRPRVTRGSIGASISHLRAVEHAKERGWPYVLVLEDDFAVKAGMECGELDTIARTLEHLLRDGIGDWDVLYLGGTKGDRFRAETAGTPAHGVARVSGLHGMFGYIVNARYYSRFVEKSLEIASRTRLEIDYGFSYDPEARLFAFIPAPLYAKPGESEVHGTYGNLTHAAL